MITNYLIINQTIRNIPETNNKTGLIRLLESGNKFLEKTLQDLKDHKFDRKEEMEMLQK